MEEIKRHWQHMRVRFIGGTSISLVFVLFVIILGFLLVGGLTSPRSITKKPEPSPTPFPTSTPFPTITPTPTPGTPVNSPTPVPPGSSPTPTIIVNTPTPLNPPPAGPGLLTSAQELAQLPTSGGAWDRMSAAANSNWGSACLHDNNCMHDVNTLAGALVAARTGNAAMKAKVISGIESAMQSSFSRTLEASRGLQAYILAADLIGYRTPAFESWLRNTLDRPMTGRAGISGVYNSALKDPSNWGNHARAAAISAALYLKDTTKLSALVNAYNEFIGLPASPRTLQFEATNWHANPSDKAGVNRKGATIQGKHVSGVLPEDWRRGGEFKWPPSPSGYMWEGMQGFVVSAMLLHRANVVQFSAGNNAVVRAMDALYGIGEMGANSPAFTNPPVSDDRWIPWLVNKYGGTNYPTTATSPGKNLGWTDWLYQ